MENTIQKARELRLGLQLIEEKAAALRACTCSLLQNAQSLVEELKLISDKETHPLLVANSSGEPVAFKPQSPVLPESQIILHDLEMGFISTTQAMQRAHEAGLELFILTDPVTGLKTYKITPIVEKAEASRG